MFGGGIYLFEEARLDRYRTLLHNAASAGRLENALQRAKKAALEIEAPEKLVRVPQGFDPEGPNAELSKYKGLTLGKRLKPAGWLHGKEALDRSEAVARAYAPLHIWMRDELCRGPLKPAAARPWGNR